MGFMSLQPEPPKRPEQQPEQSQRDSFLQRLHEMLDPVPRKESRIEPVRASYQQDKHQFALHLRPPLKKLAIVLSNFDQSIMTCRNMPRTEIISIVQLLDGKVPDDVLNLVSETYISDYYYVLNGFRPKLSKYPGLHDVQARCNAAMTIATEVASLATRPKPTTTPPTRKPGFRRNVL